MVKEGIIHNEVQNYQIRKYFQQHLLNVDIHFAQNMEYLFCAQYISDIEQIQGDTNRAIHVYLVEEL